MEPPKPKTLFLCAHKTPLIPYRYTDLAGELTAALYGHSHPTILSTINATLTTQGLNLSASTAQEATFATALCTRFALDRVRFCNSGTEANLHALAAARRFTGRRKVLVFHGGYHGAVFMFQGGVAANNVDKEDWVLARYNDLEDAKNKVREVEGELAAVLLEGMLGSGGCIPGKHEFLRDLVNVAHQVCRPAF